MQEIITYSKALRCPQRLIQWMLIPLLCFAGTSAATPGFNSDDYQPKASVVAPDSHYLQDQNDQWDLDALISSPLPNTESSTGTLLACAHHNHKHQVLTAFNPRAPPQYTPKTRIMVF